MSFTKSICLALLLFFIAPSSYSFEQHSPDLLLAKVYDNDTDVSEYWISEKYDGVRAFWNGKQFMSRQGHIYHAPEWFLQDFPNTRLDGELWIGREQFEALSSAVRKDRPIDSEWKNVRYMVFELPEAEGTFTQRLDQLKKLLKDNPSPYIKLVPQFRLETHQQLIERLNDLVKQGGEGLMMHRADSLYHTGRSDDLLKVKSYQDTEATVIRHIPGKGKYAGMLGSLLVENQAGKRFKVGSGFTDAQRKEPPSIGSVISYKYYGLTKNGIPRFASFLRTREFIKLQPAK